MRHFIHLGELQACIDEHGAQLVSFKNRGQEILWSGDPRYWADHCLILFPFIGRSFQDSYILDGQTYHVPLHGFALNCDFTVTEKTDSCISLCLKEDADTLKIFPFRFHLQAEYRLEDDGMAITFTVNNDSDRTMYFDLGFHPGFALEGPLENYHIVFPHWEKPKEIGIVTRCLLDGRIEDVPLDDDTLHLNREMFNNSARVFQGLGDTAILMEGDRQLVRIEYPDQHYLTLWQTLDSDAPFICIEGWSGLPGHSGHPEDIAAVPTKQVLPPDKNKHFKTRLTI